MMRRGSVTGFTLVELLISLAIMSVLASAIWPLAELHNRREKERQLAHALREIRTALDAYKQASDDGRIKKSIDDSGYPHKLEDLVDGVVDQKSPAGQTLYFLRRIPRDPLSPDTLLPASQMWGLRSYNSSSSNPQPGRDIFDVYSLSTGTGLNNQPYRDW